ncbi:MAG: hypothetical protein JXR49_15075 [Acidobacteria bacterium]|nr:hypothetical protein [Acidobacteriota bacterium]
MLKGYGDPVKHDGIVSLDKVWFVNDRINQALIIKLHVDYHRTQLIHFDIRQMPSVVLDSLELHTRSKTGKGYELLDDNLKPGALFNFLEIAKRIAPKYFITNRGFSLGMSPDEAVELYGAPNAVRETKDGKLCVWDYTGELEMADKKKDSTVQYVADSLGHHIKILFQDGKAMVIIMLNDVP